jgi:protein TonB
MNLPLSISLHGLGLFGLVVGPALTPSDLPAPVNTLRAFFVEPILTAPAPPPPPPPQGLLKAVRRPTGLRPTPARGLVAPRETTPSSPEKGVDPGVDGGLAVGVPGGVEGGVEGGVQGGIVGGIIGGLLPAPAAAPVEPVRVGGLVRQPKRIKYVAPEYPVLAQRARMSGVVLVEAVIGADGRVKETKVLRGIPMLDQAALAAVRQWAYMPTLIRGVPVPVVMDVTVTFDLTN